MRIDNPVILEKVVESLLETAGQSRVKPLVTEEEETIGKEILAGIREGLLEIKERRRTDQKSKTAEELLDEL